MNTAIPNVIKIWHDLIARQDPSGLNELLAEDVVFFSPVVFAPQPGKTLTRLYLTAAFEVLGGENFSYRRELYGTQEAILEFESNIDGIYINGVDLIQWNENDQITEFKVMVRPIKAVNKLHQAMAALLQKYGHKFN